MSHPKKPIQIRSLPRSNEPPPKRVEVLRIKANKPPQQPKKEPKNFRNAIFVGVATGIVGAILLFDPPVKNASQKAPAESQVTIVEDPSPEAAVNRYLQEAQLKRLMAMRERDVENRTSGKPLPPDAKIVPESNRPLGVSMDQENPGEKVYDDLYGKQNRMKPPPSPQDRIDMRLEQEKWLSQMEKQERKLFVQGFIKDARDAGYDVQLDENLIVVRVTKIVSKPPIPLEKVLENLSRKGY